MKNTFGFYTGPKEPLLLEAFLIQNTLGLAERFGIPPTVSEVSIENLANPVSVMVGTRHLPLRNGDEVLGEGKTLVVKYNVRTILPNLQRALAQQPPAHLPYLWSEIGRALRLFTVSHLRIPDEELLPLNLFPILDLVGTARAFGEDYIERDLNEREARVEIDTSIIAGYVALLLTVRSLKDERVCMDHLQDIVFEARRSNAEDILLKVW